MGKEQLKFLIGTASGVLVGGFIGYVVTQRVLKAKYELELQTEISSLKAFYQEKAKNRLMDQEELDELYPEEEYNLREFETIVRKEEYSEDSSPAEEEFDYFKTDPDFSEVRPEKESRKMTPEQEVPIDTDDPLLVEMIENRRNDEPYIITVDEFMDDIDYIDDKLTVTYFDGDDTLADTTDRVIPEVDEIIGSDALTKFGLFSKDKNIVYVRNERLRADFEIILDENKYTEVIAGFKSKKTLKKMREDI